MIRPATRTGTLHDAQSQQLIREISYATSVRDGSFHPSHPSDIGKLLLLDRGDGRRMTIRVEFVRHTRDGRTFGHFCVMRPIATAF